MCDTWTRRVTGYVSSNGVTSPITSVRPPTLRTIAYSMKIAERIARSEEGSSVAPLNGSLGTNSITSIDVIMMRSI